MAASKETIEAARLSRLGYYGLLPLLIATLVIWAAPWGAPFSLAFDAHQLALAYAGIVAAFLAGIGTGVSLSGRAGAPTLGGGIMAAIALWAAIGQAGVLKFAPGVAWRYALVIAVYLYLLARDIVATRAGALPQWYGALRLRLTVFVCLMLAAIVAKLALIGAA